mgnify:CR=1 FL=1
MLTNWPNPAIAVTLARIVMRGTTSRLPCGVATHTETGNWPLVRVVADTTTSVVLPDGRVMMRLGLTKESLALLNRTLTVRFSADPFRI